MKGRDEVRAGTRDDQDRRFIRSISIVIFQGSTSPYSELRYSLIYLKSFGGGPAAKVINARV